MCEKKEYQDPISVDEQINNLINLGLIIENVDNAKRILERISYYRLIKGYGINFKKDGHFKDNSKFEDIIYIYDFNSELRHLLFAFIEKIEISLRTSLVNYFSINYGNFGYLDVDNFDKQEEQTDVIEEIKKEIERNHRSPHIMNFKENYVDGLIPFYAAAEVTTFGTLSKFYKNMNSIDKQAIAGKYHYYLESWIENISYIRNICAHYGRLYDVSLVKTPKIYTRYRKKGVDNKTIFASIIIFKKLLEKR